MPKFLHRYGTEDQREEALIFARWPAGGNAVNLRRPRISPMESGHELTGLVG